MITDEDLFKIRECLTSITYEYAEMLTDQKKDIDEIKQILTNEVIHKLEDHELLLKDIRAFLIKRFPKQVSQMREIDMGGKYVRSTASGTD